MTERLDYTREPPGYCVGAGGDLQHEGYVWWANTGARNNDWGYQSAEYALAGSWANYKKHHDPPGCEGSDARAKSWAWYDAQGATLLTAGEQLVWAASFAHHVDGGTPAAISARIATQRVHDLRELTTAALDVLGRVGSRAGAAANLASSVVMAAVEQMRGGR